MHKYHKPQLLLLVIKLLPAKTELLFAGIFNYRLYSCRSKWRTHKLIKCL